MERTVGINVSPSAEATGLDLAQLGEAGYDHDIAGSGDIYSAYSMAEGGNVDAQSELAIKLVECGSSGNVVQVGR
jgi:hypothetical protein